MSRPAVLLVAPFGLFPPQTGGATRILGMRSALQGQYDVTVVAPRYSTVAGDTRPTIPDYHVAGHGRRREQFHCPDLVRLAVALGRQRPFVAIVACSYAAAWNGLRVARRLRVPFLLDEFNVEHARFRAMGRPVMAAAARAAESFFLGQAEAVFAVSATDVTELERLSTRPVVLAPNGYDEVQFRFQPDAGAVLRRRWGLHGGDKAAVFCGKLDYGPNREAFEFICDTLAPALPDVRFVVVGPNPPAREVPANVHVVGPVDNVAAYYNAADLVVVPLTAGGGTKLKTVEALACGKQLVSTPVGVEGLPPSVIADVVVANRASFAQAVQATAMTSSFDRLPPHGSAPLEGFRWEEAMRPVGEVLGRLASQAHGRTR